MPKPKVTFADPAAPTAAEIAAWAHCPDPEPMEDWDLVLATPAHAAQLVALVADEKCRSRGYLLAALYTLVGTAVRDKFRDVAPAELEALLGAARESGNPWLGVWATRSAELIAVPETFEFVAWCAGGLARRPLT